MNVTDTPVHRLLQQQPPFLMIDRVVRVEGEEIECHKLLSHNEPYFAGHFPGDPIFPGVLLQEACAQASLLLALALQPGSAALGNGYLVGVNEFRIAKPARPGDTLVIRVKMVERVGDYVTTKATVATTDGRTRVARGTLTFYLAQPEV